MVQLFKSLSLMLLVVGLTSCDVLGDTIFAHLYPSWVIVVDEPVIHLVIYDNVIWEPGDDARDLRNQIAHSIRLSIDGIEIPRSDMFLLDQFTRSIEVFDSENNIIGTHYGETHLYCFCSNLEPGIHTGSVEVTSTTGKRYQFTWSFEIPWQTTGQLSSAL